MAIDFNLLLLVVELILLVPTLLLLLLGRREEHGRRVLLEHITNMVKLVSTQEYFNTVHSSMRGATASIRGVITGSAPRTEEQEEQVRDIIGEIRAATKRGVVVQYLIPKAQDRLRVATLYKEAGADVRFHPSLVVGDLRFVIVDNKASVLGLPQTAGQNQPTREGYKVPSEGLSNILSNQFESKWTSGSDYDDYVSEILRQIAADNPNVSNTLLSEQLRISENEIIRISEKSHQV